MIDTAALCSAFFWGTASAMALPGGALAGMHLRPKEAVLAGLMAVGAGALLFAVGVELLYPGVSAPQAGAVPLTAGGALAGWAIFTLINRKLNKSGAQLRSNARIKRQVTRAKRRSARQAVKDLAKIDLFHRLPLPLAMQLVPRMQQEIFEPGQILCREGDPGDKLFCITEGQVSITRNGKQLAILGARDTLGEMALLTRQPRNATATVVETARIYTIPHELFQQVLTESPELRRETELLVSKRLDQLEASGTADRADSWRKNSLEYLKQMKIEASGDEVDRTAQELVRKKNTALAIWLGMLLDSIPASLIIGIHLSDSGIVSPALLGGILLADLPESLTCASHMHRGGISYRKVLLLWCSLCLLTGAGAVGGVLLRHTISGGTLLLLQGIAGGAMAGSIISAMIPDAASYRTFTAVSGVSTGFLSALLIRML